MQIDTPVLIVGAGPTGLAMAIELQRHGIPFRIIDQKAHPNETSNALGVQPRTLEIWDDQDLISRAVEEGYQLTGLSLNDKGKQIGHFLTHSLLTLYPFILALPQYKTEMMFIEYLQKQNIDVEFNTRLVQISERTDFVSCLICDKEGHEHCITTQWLIACDGCDSTVRENLHLSFEGQKLKQHFMMADVRFTSSMPKDKAEAYLNSKGALLIIPFSNTEARIIFDVTHDKSYDNLKAPTDEQLRQVVKERCPFKIEITDIIWKSGFHISEKLLKNYKHNLIFFAGDAAHVHSPAGGLGMNTGIQDVYNLAWKLAAVINKHSSITLLDSYQNERVPIARRVLMTSTMMTRAITATNPVVINLRNFLINMACRQKKMVNTFVRTLSQLGVNYIDSSLTKEMAPSAHGPKAGERFLDCYIDKNNSDRLLNYLRGTKPALLFFSGVKRDNCNVTLLKILNDLSVRYGELFTYSLIVVDHFATESKHINIIEDLEQRVHRQYHITTPRLYAIRPDKYIGFRGYPNNKKELEAYLDNLFGELKK